MPTPQQHILIAVLGGSPQVLTETLYGIYLEQQQFFDEYGQDATLPIGLRWPTAIDLLTTEYGKKKFEAMRTQTSPKGLHILNQFCEDYGMPAQVLDSIQIKLVTNDAGEVIEDTRSKADQEALGDFIIAHVAERTSQPHTQVHASIAGGRKTMTFYLGYAMSLFANVGDRLSHVLIDARYENNPQFFYPTPYANVIEVTNRNQEVIGHVDTQEAEVSLADIPFIRQRQQLNKNVISSYSNTPYKELVYFQNAINELDKIEITFDYSTANITIENKVLDFSKQPMLFAFYSMIAHHMVEQGRSYIYQPEKDSYDLVLTHLYLQELEKLAEGLNALDYQHFLSIDNHAFSLNEKAFKTNFINRCEDLTDYDFVRDRSIGDKYAEAIAETELPQTYLELEGGMSHEFFADQRTKLKKALLQYFPEDFVTCLLPSQVYRKKDLSQKREFSPTGQQKTPYGLWLDEANIRFINH